MRVAVIPARGGSKRIPKKNIKPFCGQPMIHYAIDAAKRSELFDHVIVSTDCEEIKNIALACGAEVPFLRPEALSDDHTGTGPVVQHAIAWLEEHQSICPEYVCCIYPTSPFLKASDLIDAAKALVKNSGKSFAFSVAHYAFPIQRSLGFDDNRDIKMNYPEYAPVRSQDLPESFHDAGQFYYGRKQAFVDGTVTFGPASIPIFITRSRVTDIDDEEDWLEAEVKYEVLKQKGVL